MREIILGASWLAFTYSAAFGQVSEAQLTFEVASVKPAAPPGSNPNIRGISGGPGSADPGRINYTGLPLKRILLFAYGVRNDQIFGPGWLDSESYDIVAKVAPGTTKEQLNAMLRNLLVERFNLTWHHETKDLAVYELVGDKNGPKLKEADLTAPSTPAVLSFRVGTDKDGFLQPAPGVPIIVGRTADGRMRWTARAQSIEQIATFLGGQLRRSVLDKTGLTGKYDFTLEYAAAAMIPTSPSVTLGAGTVDIPSESGPDLEGAVQEQLGLKLESKKALVDVMVLDHIDKVPTEN
jgi:uncharacterized protein (TIGR03435 family)